MRNGGKTSYAGIQFNSLFTSTGLYNMHICVAVHLSLPGDVVVLYNNVEI